MERLNKGMLLGMALMAAQLLSAQTFELTSDLYYRQGGVDVMAFNDFYPEGHQGGVSVIMNGHRVATNGDIRLEATPGQWQPVPKKLNQERVGDAIITTLSMAK